jgi:hypothetical protein
MIFNKRIWRAYAVLAGLLVTGCATKFDFDPNKAAAIHTIALTGFPEPRYQAIVPVGTRLALPQGSDSHEEFDLLMAQQNLHLGGELKAAVAHALGDAGYQVVENGAANNADAVLEGTIWPIALYATGEFAIGDFEPEVIVEVQLKDAKTRAVLFSRLYRYRDVTIKPLVDDATPLRPDPKYAFKTGQDLLDNPKLAAEGFRACEPLIAADIAAALKRPNS